MGAAGDLGTVCRARSSRVPEAPNAHPRAQDQEHTLENPGPPTLAARGPRSGQRPSSPRQRRGSGRRRPRRMEADTAQPSPLGHQGRQRCTGSGTSRPLPPRIPRQPLGRHSRHALLSTAQLPEVVRLRPPHFRSLPTAGAADLALRATVNGRGGRGGGGALCSPPGFFPAISGLRGYAEWFGAGGGTPFPFFLLLFFPTGGGAIGGWGTVWNPARGAAGDAVRPPRNGRRRRHSRFSGRATAIWERRGGPARGCRPSKPLLPRCPLEGGPGSPGRGFLIFLADLSPQPHGAREGKHWEATTQEGQEEEAGPEPAGRGRRGAESRLGIRGQASRGQGERLDFPWPWVPLLGLTHPGAPALQSVQWK